MFKLFIGGELAQEGKTIYDLTLITKQEIIDKSCYHSWEIEGKDNWKLKLTTNNITTCNDEKFIYDYYDGYKNNQICIINGLAMIKYPVHICNELKELDFSIFMPAFIKIIEELRRKIMFYSNVLTKSQINSDISRYLINNYPCHTVFLIIKFCTDDDFINTFIFELEQNEKYEVKSKKIENSKLLQITLRPSEELYVLGYSSKCDFKTIDRI